MNPETICNRCVTLVGLPDVVILDVVDVPGAALRVHVELTDLDRAALPAV